MADGHIIELARLDHEARIDLHNRILDEEKAKASNAEMPKKAVK